MNNDSMKAFAKYIDKLSEMSGKAASWLLPILTFIVAHDVIQRYFFKSPTFWAFDMSWMLFSALFLMGGAYTHLYKAHIRVDVILNRFSPFWRGIFELFYDVAIFFPLIVILIWAAIDSSIAAWVAKETSQYSPWHPSVIPIKTIIPIGFFLLGLQGVVEFIRTLQLVVEQRKS